MCKRRVCTEGEQEIETDSDSDADDTTPLVQHRANDVEANAHDIPAAVSLLSISGHVTRAQIFMCL